ncbi:MAG: hypothetical protein R3C68_12080 [Myxococcota bacterium]
MGERLVLDHHLTQTVITAGGGLLCLVNAVRLLDGDILPLSMPPADVLLTP